MEPLQHAQRRRRRQERARDEVARQPREVKNFEDEEESTTKDVDHVLHCLRTACDLGGGSVQYFKFVVDPESFARTVENMFHFSFLIKASVCVHVHADLYIYVILFVCAGREGRDGSWCRWSTIHFSL